jgi:hypothetical protein
MAAPACGATPRARPPIVPTSAPPEPRAARMARDLPGRGAGDELFAFEVVGLVPEQT